MSESAARAASLLGRVRLVNGVKFALLAGLAGVAAATPGFLSLQAFVSTIDQAALVGLVALGMGFITISGNLLSLSLGITMATADMVFIALSHWGLLPAAAAAIATGIALSAAPGFVIAYFGANPIVVSIAALGLIAGVVTYASGGAYVYPKSEADLAALSGHIGPIDISIAVFLIATILAQFLLSLTRFGRQLFLVGSNFAAAEASGIRTTRVLTAAYAVAGFFAAIAGIVAAARFKDASLEFGVGVDYNAIAAVLLGGTNMHGGHGSAWRSLGGALILAAVSTVLVLRGYSQEAQQVLTGVLILIAICIYAVDAA